MTINNSYKKETDKNSPLIQSRPTEKVRNFILENRSLTKKAPVKSSKRPPLTGKVYPAWPDKRPPNHEISPLKIKKELIQNESLATTDDKFYCKIRNNKPVAIKVSPFESKNCGNIPEDLSQKFLNNSNGVLDSDQDLGEIAERCRNFKNKISNEINIRMESENGIHDVHVEEMAEEIDNLQKELEEWKSQLSQYKLQNEALLNQNSRLILEHSNQRMENDVLVKILEKKDVEIEEVRESLVTNLAHKEDDIHILKTEKDELSNKVKALEPFKATEEMKTNENPKISFNDLGYGFLQENIFKDERKTEKFVNKLKDGKIFVTKTWKNGFGFHGISKSLKDFESVLDGEEPKETVESVEERGTVRTIINLTCKQIPGLTIKIGCRVTGLVLGISAKILDNISK